MSKFLHDTAADDDDANAIAIPRVFSENNRANKRGLQARDYGTYLSTSLYEISHQNLFYFESETPTKNEKLSNRDPVTPETTSAKSAFFNHVLFYARVLLNFSC